MGLTAWLLMGLGRCALRLRYRIKVTGIEPVAARGTRGILFLPNHPALIDPVIVISELYGRFAPSSLADKDRISSPLLAWISRRFGALPMPDLGRYGEAGRETGEPGHHEDQARRPCPHQGIAHDLHGRRGNGKTFLQDHEGGKRHGGGSE